MNIIEMKVSELIPYENNPRKNDGAVDAVAESIREFGFKVPIIADKQNVIVCGHTRLRAAEKLGLETVPVIRADDLTEEQIKAFRLADNKTGELAEWDFEKLEAELAEIEMDMAAFGFESEEMPQTPDDAVEDDFEEPTEEPKAKAGDIYQLGDHRLMCGDSTKKEDVDTLMDGQTARLLLTDPPYNVAVGTRDRPRTNKNNVEILNDNMTETEFIDFLTKALQNANDHMEAGAAYYIWYAGLHHIEFESAVRNITDWKLHEQLVWVKGHFVLGRNSDYQWMHEPCLYGWKSGAEHYFTDSRAETTVIEDKNVKLSTLKKSELVELCEKLMKTDRQTTVFRAGKPNAAELHPTVKPQVLLTRLILNSSQRGWVVLDLFGGSGSTLIACEQTGRKCYMMELDPHYIDVIIKRWEDFTGKKAVKIA